MQSYTQGANTVEANGNNVRELINELELTYPGLKNALVQDGTLRQGVAVAVDGQIVNRGLFQSLSDDSQVSFVPAIGGGLADEP